MLSNSSNVSQSSSQDTSVDTSQVHAEDRRFKKQRAPKQPWTLRRVGMVIGLVVWTFFAFMLAQAIGMAVVAVMQFFGVPLETVDATVFNGVANIIVYSLAILIAIGVPLWIKKRRTTKEEIGLQRVPHWKDIAWLIVGAIGYLTLTVFITATAMMLFPSANYDEAQETGFSGLVYNWQYIAAFISLVVVAPIAEEVLFRGYLLGKLRKYASVWLSVILSAALFAVAHGQFNVGLDTFALGVVLALLRVVTGSIWASILLHMLKNGVAFYFLFVNPIIL